ncbi:catechol O-methyltransferase 1 [Penicillium longicatenatum]|uniref:catechol O-methyltransferase 1 n=1 Tax=Penicillium longicatenatum TaxID=1561947 RepID=UPI0025467570|nr:catechol O-methyltransferase 1 [Penicillium longicatenatum]KAJ5649251.1 catechol O-methyltransferase 1 [Penicillium longicatenatum]
MGNKYYKPEETIFHDDGREEGLLAFIQSHPEYNQMRGNPKLILAAIDEYGQTRDFLMNVGHEKGKIVAEDLIPSLEPDLMVELGGYVGYSALLFGNAVKRSGGRKYLSLERSPKFAGIARVLIELAELDDVVEIVVGPCRDSLRKLRENHSTGHVDVFFIDHAKLHYVNDVKLCEELKLIGPGTTIIADNVISPGVPDYRDYVQISVAQKIEAMREEQQRLLGEVGPDKSLGNPQLVYETRLIDSFEPTGEPDSLEVTRCVKVEGN